AGAAPGPLSRGGDRRFLAVAMVLGQTLTLGLSMGLVVEFGLIGVAAASLVGPLATDVCLVQPRMRGRFGVGLPAFYRQTLLPSVLPGLAMVAVQHSLRQVWLVDARGEVALLEAINVVAFWVACWSRGVAREEREWVVGRQRGRFQRAMAR